MIFLVIAFVTLLGAAALATANMFTYVIYTEYIAQNIRSSASSPVNETWGWTFGMVIASCCFWLLAIATNSMSIPAASAIFLMTIPVIWVVCQLVYWWGHFRNLNAAVHITVASWIYAICWAAPLIVVGYMLTHPPAIY